MCYTAITRQVNCGATANKEDFMDTPTIAVTDMAVTDMAVAYDTDPFQRGWFEGYAAGKRETQRKAASDFQTVKPTE